jgi:hypothetical protein
VEQLFIPLHIGSIALSTTLLDADMSKFSFNEHPANPSTVDSVSVKAFGAVKKRGADLRFQSLVFDYLRQHQGLSSIESCKSSHASLTPRTKHVYLVGKSDGKTLVQSFSEEISNNTLPPPMDENNAHVIVLKMFARTIAKEETSGASHGECQNTNQNRHDGTGDSCLNPLTPVAGSTANKMRNTDPKLGNKVGMNSNAITPHPPTANQLSVK